MEDKEEQSKEELPTILEAIQKLRTRSTVLVYSEKPILFPDSRQTAVKTLEVNICSTESSNKAILHKLHSKIREI